MNVYRPLQCLCAHLPRPSARSFSASASRPARKRRPHYPSVKASDLKLLDEAVATEYPQYDTSEQALLEKKYTPSQIAAIKAAESAIDKRDLMTQRQRRSDPWLLPYEDDMSEVDPVTDHAPKLSPEDIPGGKGTLRSTNEIERDAAISQIASETLAKMYPNGLPEGEMSQKDESLLHQALEVAFTQAAVDPRASFTSKTREGLEALADERHSAVLPDLPRLESRMARQTRRISGQEEEDPRQRQLLQYLGWDKDRLRTLFTKTLVMHTVTNQTRMGKIRSIYWLSIAGNKNGLLGVGEGKSTEADEGRKQSVMAAIRNMKPIARYENRTTFGDLEHKVGATKVQLFARPPGFGLRTQHLIFEIARAAGLHDLAARTPRSRNKMNVIKATWEALCNQKLPDEIARARGKKLVDVRKVYYGGSVH